MAVTYSYWLVLLSIVVAIAASYVALDLASRVAASHHHKIGRYCWLAGGAISMGTGIWAMHFIGMLAMHFPIQISYDIPITLLSLLIAVIASGFALFVASRATLGPRRLLAAGILMGIGIVSMHYTGMEAMRMAPPIRYDPFLLALSIIIAVGASMLALWSAFSLRMETIFSALWKKAGSALVMGTAIYGMHYTGIAAAHYAPNSICTVAPQNLDNAGFATALGGFVLLFLVSTMLVSAFNAYRAEVLAGRVADRTAQLNEASAMLQQENTERRLVEEQIDYMAHHDTLTGLPNRVLLHERLKQAISHAQRNRTQVAVLIIDLNNFKQINDSLGHRTGDRLLYLVGVRLRHVVRKDVSVARIGGDEFVLAVPMPGGGDDAALVAQKVLNSLEEPFFIDQHELHVSASIGISLYGDDGLEVDTLMRAADTAMYHAKTEGRSNYQFFTAALNQAAQRRLDIENRLRQALLRNEFELHYQPQVDMESGIIFSAEALLRWRESGKEPISCGAFISVAEATGLILPIGEWVLRQACQQLKQWHDAGYPNMQIAVNLSARQFHQPGLLDMIQQILDETGISPRCLELEITENIVMKRSDTNLAILGRLRDMGIKLSVDDFGTGYSSLAYLQRFPVHALKIDQSFVRGIGMDSNDTALVIAIIAMAHGLHLAVIAEGVETEQQAAFLVAQGCSMAQGFYYSEAVPTQVFADLLRAHTLPLAKSQASGEGQSG